MVRTYDRDYPKASAAEVAKALGFTKQQVWGIRNQIKKKTAKTTSNPKVYSGYSRMDIIRIIMDVGISRMQETLDFMTGER